jgi:glyoxylase-like metal-dependent hydrolase (beta-lactamase superfamily II)
MTKPLIHRFHATGGGTPVNAYVLEGVTGTVVVDATLLEPDARALRRRIEELDKPLLGVVVTHAHPDHYGGLAALTDGLDVPVFATDGVRRVIERDDAVKEQILRPMFGDDWAAVRRFPDTSVADGDTVRLDGIALTVTDLGPGESPHDSIWALDGRTVFSADVAYDRTHGYLADGFHEQWLANIARLRADLPAGATLHPGHGEPCGLEVLGWQEGYIATVLEAVREADWADPEDAQRQAVERIRAYLPSGALQFLVELSLAPLARQLGVSGQ